MEALNCPRIGPEYQAEISSVIKKSKQLSLRMNPSDSESMHDRPCSFELGLRRLPMSVTWSDADTKSFALGLFIFGKNFIQVKRFIENKGMGEILSFYYGKFYKTDGYRRWSECRKIKGRNCMIGQKLFTGPRQRELLSRLICHVRTESQDALIQVFNFVISPPSPLSINCISKLQLPDDWLCLYDCIL